MEIDDFVKGIFEKQGISQPTEEQIRVAKLVMEYDLEEDIDNRFEDFVELGD